MRVSNNTEWLFFHLWKKNPETMLPCLNLNIAETIIFRWAQPYFWYFTAKDGMIVRKTKEKILLQNIEESYLNNLAKCEVVASTLTSSEDPVLKLQEKIEFEYIQKQEFHDFLFQREKSHNIIIQKFIEPKNGQNALIKVAWTPQFCLFFRKTNVNDINNQKIPLVNRLVTFEGGEHLSNSDSISSPILASELEQTCLNIVKHIHSVTSGNVQISKMVLYFKLDDKNRLWLLFCTGLKLREKVQNPHGGGSVFKRKSERPLSPVMIVAMKKDKDVQKPKIPLQYLLEDQINQIDDNSCLRCSQEGLLYDLKLKHVLEHEEKIIKGQLPKDIHYEEEPENEETAPFFGGLWGNDKGKKNIPNIMKKLYPNLTEERYLKLKKNVSLMNMSVKLCESCYLVVTENLLANAEEKNAKRMQVQMRETAKKDLDTFGFASFSGNKKIGVEKAINAVTHQVKGILEQEGYLVPNDNESQDSAKLSKYNFLPKNDETQSFAKQTRTSNFANYGEPKHSYTKSVTEVNKGQLPQLVVTNETPKAYETDIVKGYYSRTPKVPTSLRLQEKPRSLRQMRSPYATDLTFKPPVKESRDLITPEKPRAMKVPTSTTRENTTAENFNKSTVASLWKSKSTNSVQRTNYNSMISTIKDLKAILGQNLGEL